MKKVLIPILTLTICFAIIWKWTRGFSAFTVYSTTLTDAGKTPRAFPDIQFINQDGQVFEIANKNKFVLLNFVYLDCPLVCHKVNNQLEEIYHTLDTNLIPNKIEFVTVSFDLENDNIQKISKYRNYFGDDIDGWTFALPYHTNEKRFIKYLNKVGTWAHRVPNTGLINHSIYLYLISPENKIIKTFDPAREDNSKIIEQLNQCIAKS